MAKTDARVRYTVMVIKETFLNLLEQKPINKITVKELCEKADINRATFYTHFSDCFDLLEKIEGDILAEFERSLNLVEKYDVAVLVSAICDIIDENKRVLKLIAFDGANSSLIPKMIDAAREKSVSHWRKLLKNASEEELEMLYIHLSNGLTRVVAEGYEKFDRESLIDFIDKVVNNTLSIYA